MVDNKRVPGGGSKGGCGNRAIKTGKSSSPGSNEYQRSWSRALSADRAIAVGLGSSAIHPARVPPVVRKISGAPAPEPLNGPPWLIAHPLFDGDSYEFDEFFQRRIHEFGEASGHTVLFRDIGNSRQHDATYNKLRSPSLLRRDEADAAEYQRVTSEIGNEGFHRLGEMQKLADKLRIPRNELPCIAFRTDPIWYPVPRLRLQTSWLRTPEAARSFSNVVRAWLPSARLVRAIISGTDNRDLSSRLQEMLAALEEEIEHAIETNNRTDVAIADENVFTREGSTWRLRWNGIECTVLHSKGMLIIAHLLQHPKKEVHAAALRATLAQQGGQLYLGSSGKACDSAALKNYRAQITEIDAELDEANSDNDPARIDRLTRERQEIYAEVARATGIGGKIRRDTNDRERARQSVSRATYRALIAIEKENESLAQHLRNSLRIGEFLSYQPEHPTSWTT